MNCKDLDNADYGMNKRQRFPNLVDNFRPHQMKIFVNTLTLKTISLEVKHSDTIRDLKDKIHVMEGIPSDEQALVFNQTVLDDNSTLIDFHINQGSTLTLMRKSKGLMQIFVRTSHTDKTFSLEVKRSHTIAKLKTMIQDKEGIPPDQQVLIFDKMALDDNSTIAEFHIKKEATLTLMVKWSGYMQIFVKCASGNTYSMDVKRSDTISSLKAKFQDREGLVLHQHRLIFDGRSLSDSSTVGDYNIRKGSTLMHILMLRGGGGGGGKVEEGIQLDQQLVDIDALPDYV